MAAYNKFRCFVEDLALGKHDFSAHTFRVALTNTQPVNTQTAYDPITAHPVPAAANGYPAGGVAVTIQTHAQTGGTLTVGADEGVITASGGTIGPFAYAVLYNDTAASDPLIAWFEYGSSITLADGEPITVKFNNDSTDGTVFTIA